MTLTDFETRLTQIVVEKGRSDLETDYQLIQLMKALETQFKIPMFPNKKYRLENREVIHLFSKIYAYRSQLYKKNG